MVKEITYYQCEKCGNVHAGKAQAQSCCRKVYTLGSTIRINYVKTRVVAINEGFLWCRGTENKDVFFTVHVGPETLSVYGHPSFVIEET
jgi:hypothetical protein